MTPRDDNLARVPAEQGAALELLAPAGEPDAAYAAFQYGADAIYLGLKRYSARAEANNFTPEELEEVVSYAHSLTPARRVFVTVNTLIQEAELPQVIESLALLDDLRVDAVIVQDIGVARIVRRFFPRLEMHASTQLAVHNLPGAKALHELGFERVTLARELTLEEVRRISAGCGMETEIFIHGALCYSYSGLCLFSSMLYGRSGNRGKCAYPCRELYRLQTGAAEEGNEEEQAASSMPFSMKDLALPEELDDLVRAGVSCFKIEGRMKSPLYVAAATNYYRRVLDNTASPQELKTLEADVKTIFSRPWTKLYVRSAAEPAAGDAQPVDPDFVGHRGAFVGLVQQVFENRRSEKVLRFRTQRPLEIHDGLQVEIPGRNKPFGFPVDNLVVHHLQELKNRRSFTADAGSLVDVPLPANAPEIPPRTKVFCTASQAVKRSYNFERPKPGLYRLRLPLNVDLSLSAESLAVEASVEPGLESSERISASAVVNGSFPEAKEAAVVQQGAREAFPRLGDTRFALNRFSFRNPERRFVPLSVLNNVRREVTDALERKLALRRQHRQNEAAEDLARPSAAAPELSARTLWSIKIDRFDALERFEGKDLADLAEIIVDIERSSTEEICEQLQVLTGFSCPVRLALPIISRGWEEEQLEEKVRTLMHAGYRHWQAANLSALTVLQRAGAASDEAPDFTFDWSVPVMNAAAMLEAEALGAQWCCLSPEDTFANAAKVLARFSLRSEVVLYQDTPLFISETCAHASAAGVCPAAQVPGNSAARCLQCAPLELISGRSQSLIVVRRNSRTLVLNAQPYCLSARLQQLVDAGARRFRADFLYRDYLPEDVLRIWRMLRSGADIPDTYEANFEREI